eukprot:g7740.t1
MTSSTTDVLGLLGFEKLHDLGFYKWTPEKFPRTSNSQKPSIANASASDLIAATDLAPEIPAVGGNVYAGKTRNDKDSVRVLNAQLPLDLKVNLEPQRRPEGFPYVTPRSLGLWVAKMRLDEIAQSAPEKKLSLRYDVNFSFGGSALEMLLERKIDNITYLPGGIQQENDTRYRVQKVCGVIMVSKVSNYDKNLSDPGFQFERFVTGGRFEDREPDFSSLEHLQLMSVCNGKYNILFTADVDAAIYRGSAGGGGFPGEDFDLVEIKSGNPRNFGKKLVLQMISSGAEHLMYARKTNRTRVEAVVKENLARVFGSVIPWDERTKLVEGCTSEGKFGLAEALAELEEVCADIPDCMEEGHNDENVSYDLVFDARGKMQLQPTKKNLDSSVSPKEVLQEMLGED